MAQTSYGDGGFRGLADEESDLGLYIASMSLATTEDIVEVLDHVGEVNGLSSGNETANISANGVTVTAATLGVTIGSAMGTIANTAMKGITGVSDYLVHSATLERTNQGWETGSFEARGYINLSLS
tara:strand:- start:302 stop:679 length:378 start_codon:yes stop_codon:yes gene_type:complete